MTWAYPFKTLEQAKAVREAQERMDQWPMEVVKRVNVAIPAVALDAGHKLYDWRVTVETQRRPWESPETAAERVAKWVTLWAEVYGKPPTERAIQRTVEPAPNTDGNAPNVGGYQIPTPHDLTKIRPQDLQG